MPAYLIVNIEVKDPEKFKAYTDATPSILKKYSGKFLARGGEYIEVEGDWHPKRVTIIEFDDFEKAKAFYHSEEYKPLIELRQSASKADFVIVDGISKPI